METSKSSRNLENKVSMTIVESDLDCSLLAIGMMKFLHVSSGENKSSVPVPRSLNVQNGSAKARRFAEFEDVVKLQCPFCSFRFITKFSLGKHALQIHQRAVISLLQEGSTEEHLKCRFCVYKVMHGHKKVLMLHLERKHALELVAFLWESSGSSCSSAVVQESEYFGSLTAIGAIQESVPGISLARNSSFNVSHNSESANNSFSGFEWSVSSQGFKDSSSSKNPEVTWKQDQAKCQSFQGVSVGVLQKNREQAHKPNSINSGAKRKLLIDDMLSSQPSKCLVMNKIPSKVSLCSILSPSGWKHFPGKQFACGRCKAAFSSNAFLLHRIRTQHSASPRFLQPPYICGLCSASFYKNDILVRHRYNHHTSK